MSLYTLFFITELPSCDTKITEYAGNLTICEGEKETLDCGALVYGTNITMHILEGTNYGHLVKESPCEYKAVTSTTASNKDETTKAAAAAVGRRRRLADADATTSIASTTVKADAAGGASYVQCKGNKSKEMVEEL